MSNLTGSKNPNWKGGLLARTCAVCSAGYEVKRTHAASRFCSMQCVGISQRGATRRSSPASGRPWTSSAVEKRCAVCSAAYTVPRSHQNRHHCCSRECGAKRRGGLFAGNANPNWRGGLSRLPYPYNFRDISKAVIARDGGTCQNPGCAGTDKRLTAHHIDYDKQNCTDRNLICLCSACNSKANFGRPAWQAFYSALMVAKGVMA